MIFESLSDRLQETFKKLRGHGKLTEDDVNEAMRNINEQLNVFDYHKAKELLTELKRRRNGSGICKIEKLL